MPRAITVLREGPAILLDQPAEIVLLLPHLRESSHLYTGQDLRVAGC